MGEACNPGPLNLRRLRRVHSSNRFGILSEDEQETVPSTVPASTGSIRRAGRQRLVAEPSSADETSVGPTQWESGVQLSIPNRTSGLSGSAPESDLLDAMEFDLTMSDSDRDDVPDQAPPEHSVSTATLVVNDGGLVLGGLGLRSARRVSTSAHWASWADALAVIRARHPDVATRLIEELEGRRDTSFLRAAAEARRTLTRTSSFEPPSWHAVADGARPQLRDPADFEPGGVRQGWQHEASFHVEEQHRDDLLTRVTVQAQALIRSQAGAALTVVPTSRETKIPSQMFRVVLLRRLRLPLPLAVRTCRCGRLLDVCGHHRAGCAR